ncbi:MAG: hypothetical protein KDA59_26735, partial [Planctomycetales bacterium]|nr:hypothetical protein [Planctomycetales bacterium]
MLASDWLNPGQPLDVNDDLIVSPIDALIGINSLNLNGSRTLSAIESESPPPYYDVNGDGEHSPIDVLLVTNVLNANSPTVAARLAEDSAAFGGSNRDLITSDARIIGKAQRLGESAVEYTLDGGSFTAVNVSVDGDFQFDPGLARDGTSDGQHTVRFRARSESGTIASEFELTFLLDTIAPSEPVWNLAPLFDSPPLGDRTTTLESVTLAGQTSAGSLVRLIETGATTSANAQGEFAFDLVALRLGVNAFTIVASDAAGNSTQSTGVVTRAVAIDAVPPEITLDTPPEIRTNANLTVTGQVTDSDSAVESLLAQVDLSDVVQVVLDTEGRFTFTTS